MNDDDAFGVGNDDWYAVGGAALCGGGAAKPISVMSSDKGDPSNIVWRSVADAAFIPQMTIYAALRQPRPGFPATPLVCRFALNRAETLAGGFPDR